MVWAEPLSKYCCDTSVKCTHNNIYRRYCSLFVGGFERAKWARTSEISNRRGSQCPSSHKSRNVTKWTPGLHSRRSWRYLRKFGEIFEQPEEVVESVDRSIEVQEEWRKTWEDVMKASRKSGTISTRWGVWDPPQPRGIATVLPRGTTFLVGWDDSTERVSRRKYPRPWRKYWYDALSSPQ